MAMNGRVETLPDPVALAHRVADWMTSAALAAKGDFRVSLSGGSTPKALFALLASDEFVERFPWPARNPHHYDLSCHREQPTGRVPAGGQREGSDVQDDPCRRQRRPGGACKTRRRAHLVRRPGRGGARLGRWLPRYSWRPRCC